MNAMRNPSYACLVMALAWDATAARADAWTRTDTALEIAVIGSFGLDYLQTKQALRDGREQNPILDRCASAYVDNVHCDGWVSPEIYFAGIAATHAVVTRLVPQPWRTLVQAVVLGVQAKTITQNYRLGYGFSF